MQEYEYKCRSNRIKSVEMNILLRRKQIDKKLNHSQSEGFRPFVFILDCNDFELCEFSNSTSFFY